MHPPTEMTNPKIATAKVHFSSNFPSKNMTWAFVRIATGRKAAVTSAHQHVHHIVLFLFL